MSKTADTSDGGEWIVRDTDRDNERGFNSRSEAESALSDLEDLGANVELVPPGQSPDEPETDGGESPDVIDAQPVEADPAPEPEPDTAEQAAKLPERSISDDPLTWVPGEFVDEIDGSEAINRKGFEVLSHFYDVDIDPTLQVPPEETGHEYCRVRCVATMPDGREVAAYGSAHVERGDDMELLLEMADTRARKRALSIATGVGAVAVEELKNEVDR